MVHCVAFCCFLLLYGILVFVMYIIKPPHLLLMSYDVCFLSSVLCCVSYVGANPQHSTRRIGPISSSGAHLYRDW